MVEISLKMEYYIFIQGGDKMSEIYYIQNRWKLENNKLYYYGLRNKENLFNLRKKSLD